VRDKRALKRLYDASSSCYAALYRSEQERKYAAALGVCRVAPGDVVLDAGCGPGLLALYLPRGAYYVGIDISPGQLRAARSSIPGGSADLVCGDIEAPPFRRRSFDAVFCITQIHHASSIAAEIDILRSLCRRCIAISFLKRVFREVPRCARPLRVVDAGADYVVLIPAANHI